MGSDVEVGERQTERGDAYLDVCARARGWVDGWVGG